MHRRRPARPHARARRPTPGARFPLPRPCRGGLRGRGRASSSASTGTRRRSTACGGRRRRHLRVRERAGGGSGAGLGRPRHRRARAGQTGCTRGELFRRSASRRRASGRSRTRGSRRSSRPGASDTTARASGWSSRTCRSTTASPPRRSCRSTESSIVGVRGRGRRHAVLAGRENLPRDGILRVTRARRRRAAGRRRGDLHRAPRRSRLRGRPRGRALRGRREALANEFAPRVHNTGHWTIDGAETSQFENHLRAISGCPSARRTHGAVRHGQPHRRHPAARGARRPPARGCTFTARSRAGRKVGHVTLVDPDEETVARALALVG